MPKRRFRQLESGRPAGAKKPWSFGSGLFKRKLELPNTVREDLPPPSAPGSREASPDHQPTFQSAPQPASRDESLVRNPDTWNSELQKARQRQVEEQKRSLSAVRVELDELAEAVVAPVRKKAQVPSPTERLEELARRRDEVEIRRKRVNEARAQVAMSMGILSFSLIAGLSSLGVWGWGMWFLVAVVIISLVVMLATGGGGRE